MGDDMGYMGADFGAAASMDVLPVGYGQSPTQAQAQAAAQHAATPHPAAINGIDVVPAGTPKQALPPGAPTLGPVAPGNDSHTPFWVGDGSAWPQPSRGVANTPFPTQPAPTAPPEAPVLFAGANHLGAAGWQPRTVTLQDSTVVQQYPDQSFLVVSTTARDLAPVRGKRITASTHGQLWGRIYREIGNYVPPMLTAIQAAVAKAQGTFTPATPPQNTTLVPSMPAVVVPSEAGLPTWVKIALGVAAAGAAVIVIRRMFSR